MTDRKAEPRARLRSGRRSRRSTDEVRRVILEAAQQRFAISGLAAGMAIGDDWLFGPGDRPGPDRILCEMHGIVVDGLAHRS